MLAELCADLQASQCAWCQALASWLLEREVKRALDRCVKAFERPLPWLDLDALSEEPRHFAHVLAAALQRQMNVVGGLPEAPFPKNVGLLFFNDEPHRFFPATQIDVVWFPDWGSQDLACHAEQWLAAAGVRN